MSKTIKLLEENMGKHFMILSLTDILSVTQSIGNSKRKADN